MILTQKWLEAWWHQAITRPNVDLSSHVLCGIHPTASLTQFVTCVRNLPFKIYDHTSQGSMSYHASMTCVWMSSDGRHPNHCLLLTELSSTNLNKTSIRLHAFPFMKMHFKMSSTKWRPFFQASVRWLMVWYCKLWSQWSSHGLTLISAWISNIMPSKVRGEITYPFSNFNGCNVEVLDK